MSAILPRAGWAALRALLRDPARRTNVSTARVNLLAGRLICGRCGERLVGRPRPDGTRRYVCLPKALGGCNGVAILAEPTEAEGMARVLAALDSPAMREALSDAATVSSPTDPLGERAEAETRMAELAGPYAAGEITRGEWQAGRAVLAARLAASGPVVRSKVRVPADVGEAWPRLDLEERGRTLAIVVESITIGAAVHMVVTRWTRSGSRLPGACRPGLVGSEWAFDP